MKISVLSLVALGACGRSLFDRGGHLGFWILARLDTVRTLDQQYQP